MINEINIETYLYIGSQKFIVSVFDKSSAKNLFRDEFFIKDSFKDINFEELSKFLDSSIFNIEKLIGKFIKNIYLVIESNNSHSVNFSIKKKNYGDLICKKNLQYVLSEAKDLFKESYSKMIISHMLIENYLIDGLNYKSLDSDLKCNNFCLEINFIYFNKDFILELDNIFERYQISISKIISANYVKKFLSSNNADLCEMALKIREGYNENEVLVVPKNLENKGFFEKFFQLFN
jgi:hypothetical protein